MRARAITPERAVEEVRGRIDGAPRETWRRVAVDGAPAAEPWVLADALAGPLRAAGRDVVRVSARDFLRPASLRYEFGREDPDVYYDEWLDVGGLMREVLAPLEPGGTGKVLPSLWDSERDRATRARYTAVQPGGVLLLDGALLLGRGLPFDLVVHLTMSPAALARRTPEEEAWTLPAFARYDREADPLRTADVVLKTDDPRHPALIESV
ncbi:nucleoside/nucleotide kinase family protein [Actinomadura napierensis]|uniref:Uridine kinase n=1 Tax=Actinomadura napierensis TaxID=267854 RepID=A0ABP5JVY3_9ACTN